MNRIILLNNDNSLYLTGSNTYVISKVGTRVYEISKVDDHCDIIGWGKSLSECSEIIVEFEKSVREGLCILC